MARAFRLPGPNYPSVFFHCVFDFANGLLSFTLLLLNSAFDFKLGVTGGLAYLLLDVANRFVRYAFDLVRSAAHDLTPFGSDVKVDASVDCESAQGVSLPIVNFMKRCAEHSHGGLWRDDAVPLDASINLQWYVQQAKEAEAARFDFLFIVDSQYITPLNIARSRQGQPPLVQAGTSPEGRDLSARVADVVFSFARTPGESLELAADVRRRAREYQRNVDEILFMPALNVVIADTLEEAARIEASRSAALSLEKMHEALSRQFNGRDFRHCPLDEPFPVIDGVDASSSGLTKFRDEIEQGRQ